MWLSDSKFKKLHESIGWANRQLTFPRAERIKAIRQFVGSHYSDDGARKKVPTNLMKLAVDIYVRQLAARAPRALITSNDRQLVPTAANLEIAVNQVPDEIGLTETLRRVVTEAMFSIGIVKMGLSSSGEMLGQEYGTSFVDDLTIDDYFCDMSVKRRDLMQFEGNDYWLPYDKIMESDWFSKKEKSGLMADEYQLLGEHGQERAESVSVSETPKLYKDKKWLRDVWLPDERVMITYSVRDEKILKTIEWDDDDGSPYDVLGFSDVPGNLLPLPPVAVWYDLHELGNALYRKLANQADSQKTVLGFSGGDEEGVGDFAKAKDGEGIRYSGTEPKTLEAGGVNPNTLAFYLQNRDLYSYFAGNLDSLGGLSPQAETLGQDKLIAEAASAQLRDMRARTLDFDRRIFQRLAYYEWTDPVKRRTLEKPIPETDMTIQVPWTPRERKGSIKSFDLKVDVYSLQDDSPGLKLQKLGVVMQQYVLPLAPLIQEQGGSIDVQKIIQLVAKYADLPELADIVQFVQDLGAEQAGQQSGGAPKPAETTRRYERVNRPGATEGGKSQIMQQLLLGGRPQGSQVESVGRRTG